MGTGTGQYIISAAAATFRRLIDLLPFALGKPLFLQTDQDRIERSRGDIGRPRQGKAVVLTLWILEHRSEDPEVGEADVAAHVRKSDMGRARGRGSLPVQAPGRVLPDSGTDRALGNDGDDTVRACRGPVRELALSDGRAQRPTVTWWTSLMSALGPRPSHIATADWRPALPPTPAVETTGAGSTSFRGSRPGHRPVGSRVEPDRRQRSPYRCAGRRRSCGKPGPATEPWATGYRGAHPYFHPYNSARMGGRGETGGRKRPGQGTEGDPVDPRG